MVYAALDPVTVDAEFRRLTERARLSPAALQPRQLSSLRLDLKNVLDLRQASVQEALGIQPAELLAEDPALPRLIGEVAHEMGYEAVVAPSAAGAGDVIAIFPANRGPDSQLQVAGARPYRPDVAD